MLRYFLVLAVTDGSLLVASFVLGLIATGEPRGPHAVWRAIHLLFALLTTMATLAVHSIVYTYFLATGKWAKEVVRVYQLPEWVNDQAKKNKRKAFRFELWSMTLIAVTDARYFAYAYDPHEADDIKITAATDCIKPN